MKIATGWAGYSPDGSNLSEAIELAIKDGFTAFEINVFGSPVRFFTSQSGEIRAVSQKLDIPLAVHANEQTTNLASENEKFRQESVGELLETIKFTAEIGAKILVFHPGKYENRAESAYKNLRKSLETIGINAQKAKIVLALENMEDIEQKLCARLPGIKKVLDWDKNLRLTFDFAHAAINNPRNYWQLWEKLKSWVVHIHLSGVKKGQMHFDTSLAESKIDFSKVIKELKSLSFIVRIENKDYKKSLESLAWIKRLTG